jgi:hypothetical protein
MRLAVEHAGSLGLSDELPEPAPVPLEDYSLASTGIQGSEDLVSLFSDILYG